MTQISVRSSRFDLSILTKAIGFFVHSNIFISVSATSVAVTTILLSDLRLEALPLFIVFTATFFVYSLNRITDIAEDKQNVPGRAEFTERYGKPILVVGGLLYLTAVGVAFYLGLPGAPFLGLPVFVALFYSGYAKSLFFVKNLTVGIAWGSIPLGVGVYYGVLWTPEILFLAFFFGVTLTVAAALFDIKDIEGDKAEGISTIPIVLGARATRIRAAVVTLALVPVVVAAGFVLSKEFLLLLPFLGYILAYTPMSTRDRGSLFYGFVIDGEHVFLALIVVVSEILIF